MTTKRDPCRWHHRVPIVCGAMLSIVVAACVQTPRTNSRLPESDQGAGVAAISDPLVLNGVAYRQGDATRQSNGSNAPPPNADIVAAPAGGTSAPVVSSTPLPSSDPALTVTPAAAGQPDVSSPATASQASAPSAVSAPTTTADGYPNINLAPKQPQSDLLTPEERAKLIEELNALAGRSGGGQ